MIKRYLEQQLKQDISKGKILLILGARQVGKTTLLESIFKENSHCLVLNCDNFDDRLALEGKTTTQLKALISGYKMLVIDEAQKVKDIGLVLKMIADLKVKTSVIATGSSSLHLADGANETATGRIWHYDMFPVSLGELIDYSSQREESRLLEQRLVFGMYPEVITTPSDARKILLNLANGYLYKDILEYKGLRKPTVIQNLVRALALQLGNEVSYNELSSLLGINKETVETYIDLLEKAFVVFRLPSYSGNLRNEIKKGKKIYFYDNGIRNAVLNNFAPLELRTDTGALWENFMISERIKRNSFSGKSANLFFWRTIGQNEIDLIEERDGTLQAYEFKWNPRRKAKVPKAFASNYPNHSFTRIDRSNYLEFIQ